MIHLVDQLVQDKVIKSSNKRIIDAMSIVDRADFVKNPNPPYEDKPQSMGYNVDISAPHMHAYVLVSAAIGMK